MAPDTPPAQEPDDLGAGGATAGADYAERLRRLEGARWKQIIDVQRPYRWNLRRLQLGRCLDVGCGIGRNLVNLGPDAIGVDHNADAVATCRQRGLTAYTTQELAERDDLTEGSFDSLLIAHVLKHVDEATGDDILRQYLPYVRPAGRVVVITPQEAGFRSDATHIRWVDHAAAVAHAERLGLRVDRTYSFPLPRLAGRGFRYNEFVTLLRVP